MTKRKPQTDLDIIREYHELFKSIRSFHYREAPAGQVAKLYDWKGNEAGPEKMKEVFKTIHKLFDTRIMHHVQGAIERAGFDSRPLFGWKAPADEPAEVLNSPKRKALSHLLARAEAKLDGAENEGEGPKRKDRQKPIKVSKTLVAVVKKVLCTRSRPKFDAQDLAKEVKRQGYKDLPSDPDRTKTEISNAVRELRRQGYPISRNPYQYGGKKKP